VTVLINNRAEMDALGLRPAEGPAPVRPLTVPIFASEKLLGAITLDSHDSARQFSETTSAVADGSGGYGVTLENARLFSETKEALHNVEERQGRLTEALDTRRRSAGFCR
jgi:hypothetical protein